MSTALPSSFFFWTYLCWREVAKEWRASIAKQLAIIPEGTLMLIIYCPGDIDNIQLRHFYFTTDWNWVLFRTIYKQSKFSYMLKCLVNLYRILNNMLITFILKY